MGGAKSAVRILPALDRPCYQAPNARVDLEREAEAGLIVFHWSHAEHDGGTGSPGKALSLAVL